jgi:CubicO group peptidase (beta-lactamase class C family)
MHRFDPRTLVAWAAQQKVYFPPGEGYHYSNTNYLRDSVECAAHLHD